jgi:MFS family permease
METGSSQAPARRGIRNEILNFLFVRRDAPFYARYTLHHHLRAGILEGVCYGIIGLNTYVAKRSLSATTNEIAALASLPMVVFLFSSVWAQFMTDRNNSRFILLSGILGRLSLVAFFFIESSTPLVGMIVLYNLMHSVFMPAQSRIFQANYSSEMRGRAYSLVHSRTMLVSALVAYGAGRLLDINPFSYKWLFPFAGLVGLWAYYRYALIGMRGAGAPQEPRKKGYPFSDFFSILSKDRRFLWYEAFFFIYGLGFMTTLPLIYYLFDEELNMNYDDFAGAYMMVPQIIMLALVPLYGRLMDRLNPIRLSAIAFAFLAFWPLTLAFATRIWYAYLAFVFYGAGMAAVQVTWTLGALYFAPAREAQKYHSVHVTLVGLRACFAPWLAVKLFMPQMGLRSAFYLGFAFFAVAAVLMFLLHLRTSGRETETVSPEESAAA